MGVQNNFLFIAFLIVSFIALETWQVEFSDPENFNKENKIEKKNIIENEIFKKQNNFITIITDLLILKINTYGGNIEEVSLRTYFEDLENKKLLKLLETSKNFIYQAENGLVKSYKMKDNNIEVHPIFKSEKNTYVLSDDLNDLSVSMVYDDNLGMKYTKNFVFTKNSFAFKVNHKIQNYGNSPIEIVLFSQLKQSTETKNINENYNFNFHTYRGAAYSSDDHKYKKYEFNDITNNKHLNITTMSGWIAMLQQYFLVAWIPEQIYKYHFYTENFYGHDQVIIGFRSYPISILKGEEKNIQSTLWIGPKLQDTIKTVANHLNLTIDYGWLWFIAQPLFKMLTWIYKYTNNWGISIVLITFIVRGLMYPLTKSQYTSMAKMRILQPKIINIKNKFSQDKHRQSQEMIALYKKQKVNPLGGCMPLFIQMPIFLALYYMLSGSVELRHAPFILWIYDLSEKDPYYILPIIMGITMLLIQKMSPSTHVDPIQKRIVTFIPLIFTIFFLWFPSGLVLYYIVSNLVTMMQQYIIYKGLKRKGIYTEI